MTPAGSSMNAVFPSLRHSGDSTRWPVPAKWLELDDYSMCLAALRVVRRHRRAPAPRGDIARQSSGLAVRSACATHGMMGARMPRSGAFDHQAFVDRRYRRSQERLDERSAALLCRQARPAVRACMSPRCSRGRHHISDRGRAERRMRQQRDREREADRFAFFQVALDDDGRNRGSAGRRPAGFCRGCGVTMAESPRV